jgi:hypothetical protein
VTIVFVSANNILNTQQREDKQKREDKQSEGLVHRLVPPSPIVVRLEELVLW